MTISQDQTRITTEICVVDAYMLTRRIRRIRFCGEDLAALSGSGGIHMRFSLNTCPHEGIVERIYTVRAVDLANSHIVIDFVLHTGDGWGSRWAAQANIGDRVIVTGPIGRRPVQPAAWYLLGADETGAPALSRILENLPRESRGIAFLQVQDETEQFAIINSTLIAVHWLHSRNEEASCKDLLVDAIRSVNWPHDKTSFGWFAGEASTAKSIRDYWRREKQLGPEKAVAASYWRGE